MRRRRTRRPARFFRTARARSSPNGSVSGVLPEEICCAPKVTFPLECVRINENERYPFKLDDKQAAKMIKFAVTLPKKHRQDMEHGIGMLDWKNDATLRNTDFVLQHEGQCQCLHPPTFRWYHPRVGCRFRPADRPCKGADKDVYLTADEATVETLGTLHRQESVIRPRSLPISRLSRFLLMTTTSMSRMMAGITANLTQIRMTMRTTPTTMSDHGRAGGTSADGLRAQLPLQRYRYPTTPTTP